MLFCCRYSGRLLGGHRPTRLACPTSRLFHRPPITPATWQPLPSILSFCAVSCSLVPIQADTWWRVETLCIGGLWPASLLVPLQMAHDPFASPHSPPLTGKWYFGLLCLLTLTPPGASQPCLAVPPAPPGKWGPQRTRSPPLPSLGLAGPRAGSQPVSRLPTSPRWRGLGAPLTSLCRGRTCRWWEGARCGSR